ncbi:MAG: proteasome subunit alpha, partial [Nitrospiraceae bacterium]
MGMEGDFLQLLKERGYQIGISAPAGEGHGAVAEITRGTTILAMKYQDGVLVAGDRRATAGNTVM